MTRTNDRDNRDNKENRQRDNGDNMDGDGHEGRKLTALGWLLNPTWMTLENLKHHNSLRQPAGMVMHNINNT
jgi:hypothetical protein